MALELLAWDSEWLGVKVGRLQSPALTWHAWQRTRQRARREGYKLLYWLVQPTDRLSLQTAARAAVLPIDCRLTYVGAMPGGEAGLPPAAAVRRVSGGEFFEPLRELVLLSGDYSRFRLDPRISQAAHTHLYEQWLRNALRADDYSAVLTVPDSDGEYSGLLIMHRTPAGAVNIDLLATLPRAQRQGLAKRLLISAQAVAEEWGAGQIQLTTQLDNRNACRLYDKLGMQVRAVQLAYHLWL